MGSIIPLKVLHGLNANKANYGLKEYLFLRVYLTNFALFQLNQFMLLKMSLLFP